MADLLGAAASLGMIILIGMLVADFLQEIGRMEREKLMGIMKAAGICCLFALEIYALIAVIRVLMYGTMDMRLFSSLVQHDAFRGLWEQSAFPVHYKLAGAVFVTGNGFVLLYHAAVYGTGEKKARKIMACFGLMPGMEYCFLPLKGSVIWLGICLLLFLLRKKVHGFHFSLPKWGIYIYIALASFLRCYILYRFVTGV